ncbi:hypothetical protein D3C77_524130 [compost metagenome]|uniref:hypothetical protein n=1 Tax=Pseudomonas sp. 5 TaxID=1619949 RepID=UPI0005EB27EC|nr:hypothetical protein [Pseudomonas sp. 5]KJK09306.1 hypothetical protein UB47_01830 [Pseudomonas sp. 5]
MSWLTAVQYGAAGISGIMLIAAFKIIQTEQRRTTPRQVILRYTIIFMAFAFAILVVNVLESKVDADCEGALKALKSTIESKVRYEYGKPNPNHSQLQATITALVRESNESLKACRVTH